MCHLAWGQQWRRGSVCLSSRHSREHCLSMRWMLQGLGGRRDLTDEESAMKIVLNTRERERSKRKRKTCETRQVIHKWSTDVILNKGLVAITRSTPFFQDVRLTDFGRRTDTKREKHFVQRATPKNQITASCDLPGSLLLGMHPLFSKKMKIVAELFVHDFCFCWDPTCLCSLTNTGGPKGWPDPRLSKLGVSTIHRSWSFASRRAESDQECTGRIASLKRATDRHRGGVSCVPRCTARFTGHTQNIPQHRRRNMLPEKVVKWIADRVIS